MENCATIVEINVSDLLWPAGGAKGAPEPTEAEKKQLYQALVEVVWGIESTI